MATQLKNIVAFTAVGSGALATLPHGLNWAGRDLIPDHLEFDNGDFTFIAATATSVTVRNDGGAPANLNVLVEAWHTFERAFGASGVESLSPQPFVGATAGTPVASPDRYAPPEKWQQQNVAAGQVSVPLSALISTSFDTIKMIRAGSVVGLSTKLTAAITDANAGSLVVAVTINGVAGALSIAHSSALNANGGETTQISGVDTFVAGDEIGVELSTLGTFAPTTTDLEAWLDLQF